MRFLFIFAHPDDETVSCAHTLLTLADRGHTTKVISVTAGDAGQAPKKLQKAIQAAGGLGNFRKAELESVCQLLHVGQHQVLNFQDGEITNSVVWGALTLELIEQIDAFKPDVLVTFEHTGWYFHLDHVGVSIAATTAFQQAKHQTPLLLLSHMPFSSDRWQYVFAEEIPMSFAVTVADPNVKLKALELHASQDLSVVTEYVNHGQPHHEWFQVGFARQDPAVVLEPVKDVFVPTSAVLQREHLEQRT